MNPNKILTLFTRSLILISVVFILITALGAFIHGAVDAGHLFGDMVSNGWTLPKVEYRFIEVIEHFLTAIALLLLGIGLYELFIQPLNLPPSLKVKDFHQLKTNLGNVILLNMVIIFFGDLSEEKPPSHLVLEAVAIALVSLILILFAQPKEH